MRPADMARRTKGQSPGGPPASIEAMAKLTLAGLMTAFVTILGWAIDTIVRQEQGEAGLSPSLPYVVAPLLCVVVSFFVTRRMVCREQLPSETSAWVVAVATAVGLGLGLWVLGPLDRLFPGPTELRVGGELRVPLAAAAGVVLTGLGAWAGIALGAPGAWRRKNSP